MIGIAPVFWLDWGLGTDEDAAPRLPQVDMLAAHNAVTADPRKDQHRLDKLLNRGHYAAHATSSLEQLPETVRPPGPANPLGGGRAESLH